MYIEIAVTSNAMQAQTITFVKAELDGFWFRLRLKLVKFFLENNLEYIVNVIVLLESYTWKENDQTCVLNYYVRKFRSWWYVSAYLAKFDRHH